MFDKAKLVEVSNSNPVAKAIFTEWAGRQRTRKEVDAGRLRLKLIHGGLAVDNVMFEKALTDLVAIGIGRVARSRWGTLKRFEPFYSIKEIGQAALNPDAVQNVHLLPGMKPNAPEGATMTVRGKRGRPKGSRNRLATEHAKVLKTGITGLSASILVDDVSLVLKAPSGVTKAQLDTVITRLKELASLS